MKNIFKSLISFLPTYYELTIIPSIVLGCLLNLIWCVIGYIPTTDAAIFPFVFIFVLMTIEDVIRATVKYIKGA